MTDTATGIGFANSMKVQTSIPANSSAVGIAGTMSADANYIYICIAANTWRRVQTETF